jgi:DNA recombination protein RmuC
MVEAGLVVLALIAGGVTGWLISGARSSKDLKAEIERRSAAEAQAAALGATLESERRESEKQLKLLNEARQSLIDAFDAVASQALKSNNQAFLDLAKQALEVQQIGAKADLEKRQQAIVELVTPVKTSLEKFEAKVGELEKTREGAYAGLTEQVKSLLAAQTQLRTETTNLVQALRAPVVRGRWGEIQLRRVVEMAGMLNHCDFFEQESAAGESGRLRPDMVVRLPAGKTIVVDAKAPITSYLDAVALTDVDARNAKLVDYARLVRSHVTALGRKAYWDQFDPSPELVVLFLPGEHFFGAALEQDPALIEFGVDQKVIIATPTTLISLLRAVAYGWRQEAVAQNAKEISVLAGELYKRISDMGEHFASIGESLGKSVDAYNRAVASLETRVLVSARKFKELGATPEAEVRVLTPVEKVPHEVRAPEFGARIPEERKPLS